MKWFACTLLALLSGWAGAHPVDEVVQGAYLTLTPGKVLLELDLTPGEKVAGTMLKSLDTNGDGKASVAEARAYATQVLGQSTLRVGTVAVPWTLDEITVPPLGILKVGGDTIKIYATARRPEVAGGQTFSYQNRYQPVKSQWIANVFLQPAGGWQYGVTGQQHSSDGQQLTVKYTVTRP
ncbi:hypothetical protein [Deinococcus ruber]|uniref:EF-hand domain-containing protein n=1 Tax=Deinococcus ruber TaxID=1848197 RepID=A0A918CE14_9DEIO|nr:hypothetical protein [Deinococcus ruber]GGR17896.1 hypothetical protein GCM10008957_33310 [Deinococcus ruber]